MCDTIHDTTIPRIGDPAPQFETITTHGVKKLTDYQGKWVVLFAHPAAFTPTCLAALNPAHTPAGPPPTTATSNSPNTSVSRAGSAIFLVMAAKFLSIKSGSRHHYLRRPPGTQ